MAKSLQATLNNVETLIEDREAEAFFAEAWEEEEPELPPASSDDKAGRLDGSDNSLASGHGNLPLNLKLQLGSRFGQLPPVTASEEALQQESFSRKLSIQEPALQRRARAASVEALEAANQQQSLQLHSQFWGISLQFCSFAAS